MENLSKALLIAGGVLIAILLVSLATRVFNSASEVSKAYNASAETTDINTFNTKFTRFIGAVTDGASNETQQYATMHDIITLANFAKDHNHKENAILATGFTDTQNPAAVRIDIGTRDTFNGTIKTVGTNIQDLTQDNYNVLMSRFHYKDNNNPNSNSIITYKIDIQSYNPVGRVNHVLFYTQPAAGENYKDTINNNLENTLNSF